MTSRECKTSATDVLTKRAFHDPAAWRYTSRSASGLLQRSFITDSLKRIFVCSASHHENLGQWGRNSYRLEKTLNTQIRVQVIFQSLNPRMMINGCHQLPNNAIHLQSTYTDDFLPNTTCNFLNSRNRIAKSTSKPLQENPNSKETCNRLLAILPTRAVMFSWTPGHG